MEVRHGRRDDHGASERADRAPTEQEISEAIEARLGAEAGYVFDTQADLADAQTGFRGGRPCADCPAEWRAERLDEGTCNEG